MALDLLQTPRKDLMIHRKHTAGKNTHQARKNTVLKLLVVHEYLGVFALWPGGANPSRTFVKKGFLLMFVLK